MTSWYEEPNPPVPHWWWRWWDQLWELMQETSRTLPVVGRGSPEDSEGGFQFNNNSIGSGRKSRGKSKQKTSGHAPKKPKSSGSHASKLGAGGIQGTPDGGSLGDNSSGYVGDHVGYHQGGAGSTPPGKGIADGKPLSSFPSIPNLPNALTGKPAAGSDTPPAASSGGSGKFNLPGLGVSSDSKPQSLTQLSPGAATNTPSVEKSGSIGDMLGKAGFTGSQIPTMKAIIQAESGGNPAAVNHNTNGTIDRGLAQINSVHKQFDQSRLSDPQYNLNAAHQVFQSQGLKAWSTYNNGAYKKFLGAAPKAANPLAGAQQRVGNSGGPAPAKFGVQQPVAHPGTTATHVPFKAAVANRGHATTHPPTPSTSHASVDRHTRPAHAAAKATGGTQHTHSSGSKAGAAKTKSKAAATKKTKSKGKKK